MEFVKNILKSAPQKLEELISVREGQVISMALSKVENAPIILFAMSAHELISEEAYEGDTLYYVLSGEMVITADSAEHRISAGDIMAVPAHAGHSLWADRDTKFLQLILRQ